jgi:60 kDa SS-A/Ro ribonucleoprotein
MVNKVLFETRKTVQDTDVVNEAGGKAYSFSPKHALAQMAVTGVFGDTYYTTARQQLDQMQDILSNIDDDAFIAKVAIYASTEGFMKDMPAYLTAYLAAKGSPYYHQIGPKVIYNGRMLRNFVQYIRSGVFGRKSFGTSMKKFIQNWIVSRDYSALFKDSVGNDPSMADIIKMTHPRPKDDAQRALFGYLVDKSKLTTELQSCLPEIVQQYEKFKETGKADDMPRLPFGMIAALEAEDAVWTQLLKESSWQQTRMNLNTFKRHGVFDDKKMVKLVADRLRDREAIQKARVFPYQLLAAYKFATDIPREIVDALHDAVDLATENTPTIEGNTVLCIDTSGSMTWSEVMGTQGRSPASKINAIDVAGLFASCLLRNNPDSRILPFAGNVYNNFNLEPRDTVLTNARRLASLGGGSTNCSAPLALLNQEKAYVDNIIYVSDNESWIDSCYGTNTLSEWNTLKRRCPKAKMICIDTCPNSSTQARDDKFILNIGGFSDNVFKVVAAFLSGSSDHWVTHIDNIKLD